MGYPVRQKTTFNSVGSAILLMLFAPLGRAQSVDFCARSLETRAETEIRVEQQTQWIGEIPKERALVPYDPIHEVELLKIKINKIVSPEQRGFAPTKVSDLEEVLGELSRMSKILYQVDEHTPWAQEIFKKRQDLGEWAEKTYLSLMEAMLKTQKIKTTRVTLGDGSRALQIVADSESKAQRIAAHLSQEAGITVNFSARNISENTLGFFRGSDRMIVLNHNMILMPQSGMRTYLHESRHAQYFSKRLNRKPSIFHGSFLSTDTAPFSASPIYNTYMSLEELMTHSLDTRVIGGWLDVSMASDPSYETSKKLSNALRNLYGKAKNSYHISVQSLALLEKIKASREIGHLDFSLQFIKNNKLNTELDKILWADFRVGNVRFNLPFIGSEWNEITSVVMKEPKKFTPEMEIKLNASFNQRVDELIQMNQELIHSYGEMLGNMKQELFSADGKWLGTSIDLKAETILKLKEASKEPRRITLKYDAPYQPSGTYRID